MFPSFSCCSEGTRPSDEEGGNAYLPLSKEMHVILSVSQSALNTRLTLAYWTWNLLTFSNCVEKVKALFKHSESALLHAELLFVPHVSLFSANRPVMTKGLWVLSLNMFLMGMTGRGRDCPGRRGFFWVWIYFHEGKSIVQSVISEWLKRLVNNSGV